MEEELVMNSLVNLRRQNSGVRDSYPTTPKSFKETLRTESPPTKLSNYYLLRSSPPSYIGSSRSEVFESPETTLKLYKCRTPVRNSTMSTLASKKSTIKSLNSSPQKIDSPTKQISFEEVLSQIDDLKSNVNQVLVKFRKSTREHL